MRDVTRQRQAEQRERQLLVEAAAANAKFHAFFDQGALVCRNHGCERHDARGEPSVVGGVRLQQRADHREAVLGRPVVGALGAAEGTDQGGVSSGSRRRDLPCGTAVLRGGRQRAAWRMSRSSRSGTRRGSVLFLATTGVDITDRKKAEADREKFVALVESSTDFIGMCDLQGVPFFVNRAGLTMVGLEDIDAARRVPVRVVLLSGRSRQGHARVLPVGTGEGSRRDRGSLPAFQDRRGTLDGLQGADAARRHGTADRVRDGQPGCDRAEATWKTICEVWPATCPRRTAARTSSSRCWRTSCGIRSPRSATPRGRCALAAATATRFARRPEMLERQVGQLARLVDDLLDMSRITRGRIELRKERIELAPIVDQAVEAVRALYREHGPRADGHAAAAAGVSACRSGAAGAGRRQIC